jgi:predicted nucleotidyltransferase
MESKALKEFVKRVKEKHGDRIEKIVLFGSYARGDYTRESDIDVLVVTAEDSFKMQRMLSEIVTDILLETEEYVSVKVLSVEEYEFQERIKSGFFRNVSKEGVVIG